MSYISSHLMADERILFTTRRHWLVLLQPIIVTVIVAVIISVIYYFFPEMVMSSYGLMALAACSGTLGIYLLIITIQFRSAEYGVTNSRLIIKEGIIWRKSLELLVDKVESIEVNQSFFGRVLGYGTLVIRGTGGTPEAFRKIAKPLQFRRYSQESAVALRRENGSSSSAARL